MTYKNNKIKIKKFLNSGKEYEVKYIIKGNK